VIDAAVRLAGSDARRLTVVHAADSIEAASAVRHPARWLVPEYRGHVLDDARRGLQAAMPPGIDGGIAVELRVVPGPVAETIGKQAAAVDAHLIVVARNRRFTRLGSTTLRMLRRGDRTMLVLPPSASAQPKPVGRRAAEPKSIERGSSETKDAGTHSADTPQAEAKPSVSNSAGSNSVASNSVAPKALDMTPADTKPVAAPKPAATVVSPPPEGRKPRRMSDIAALIDRALRAVRLK
jgi:nucleotide-binding universal stress UspA family protein